MRHQCKRVVLRNTISMNYFFAKKMWEELALSPGDSLPLWEHSFHLWAMELSKKKNASCEYGTCSDKRWPIWMNLFQTHLTCFLFPLDLQITVLCLEIFSCFWDIYLSWLLPQCEQNLEFWSSSQLLLVLFRCVIVATMPLVQECVEFSHFIFVYLLR